jgi:hypothetical protein
MKAVSLRPDWTLPTNSKLVWSEDDATVLDRGHETVSSAFLRIFGQAMPEPEMIWDAGDATFRLLMLKKVVVGAYPKLQLGLIVVIDSYPGNSSVRVLCREDKVI